MTTPSGPAWCDLYPGSDSLDGLVPAFRSCVAAFLGALKAAGADYTISATFRPPERAYLMHFCCLVAGYRDKAGAFHQIQPQDVPKFVGPSEINIDWTHGGDVGAARASAVEMRLRYGIAYPAALISNHTKGEAIDISIRWSGRIVVKTKNGSSALIDGLPRNGTHPGLALVGKSYGVIKLVSDPPHFSSDGH